MQIYIVYHKSTIPKNSDFEDVNRTVSNKDKYHFCSTAKSMKKDFNEY